MSIFNTNPMYKPGRNKFDLSYTNMTTMNIGDIVPIMAKDMVPGDKFRVKTSSFVRMMPLANPTFQNLRLYMHYFFVPYRLLYDNWENFITGNNRGEYGLPSVADELSQPLILPFNYTVVDSSYRLVYSNLLDSLGYPAGQYLDYNSNTDPNYTLSNSYTLAYRLRAYWLIYNEWYRDQNVDDIVYFPRSGGFDDLSDWKFVNSIDSVTPATRDDVLNFARRRYHKDYFTSALPWPQRGEEVTLPFGGIADLVNDNPATWKRGSSDDSGAVSQDVRFSNGQLQATFDGSSWEPMRNTLNTAYADLSAVTSATINDLRRAVALQRFFETSARGGSRYIETILSHFGVHSKDARLQRPEFLGGGITPIQIGEVLQTTPTDESPLATMAGRGYAVGNANDNGCVYYATEHGVLMCLASIVPESLYFQGIDRHLQKFDRLDYYWPAFAHLGEQEIRKKELFAKGSSDDEALFGYAPRYAEYKHSRNELHGGFITDPTLQNWTFARKFDNSPALTSEFLAIPDITGPFAVEDGDKFLCQIHHQIDALRPMPYYSDPRLI